MGSNETAFTIPEGPRVIDVFYGNGAPSGPNYTLFSGADRLSDSLSANVHSSTSTAHKPTPRVHTLLATACN